MTDDALGADAVAKVTAGGRRAAIALTVAEIEAMAALCLALAEKVNELDPDWAIDSPPGER